MILALDPGIAIMLATSLLIISREEMVIIKVRRKISLLRVLTIGKNLQKKSE